MQFGALLYSEFAPSRPESFELLLAEVTAAEAAGFDAVELIEHHQGLRGEFSAPLIWLAALAARTRSIKLATGVALLPLYHPVRLAEDLASLDIIAGGRTVFGVGLGYQEGDFAAFGVPIKERVGRFREALAILELAWQDPVVTFSGKYHQLDRVRIVPQPPRPRIPVMGGGMTEPAIRRVARECDGWLAPSSASISALEHLVAIYREEALRHGRKPYVVLHRNGYVAPTREQAIAEYEPALLAHYEALQHKEGSAVLGDVALGAAQAALAEDRCVIGSPADCIRLIAAYRDRLAIDGMVLRMRTTFGPRRDAVLQALRLFGAAVIPHFRGKPA